MRIHFARANPDWDFVPVVAVEVAGRQAAAVAVADIAGTQAAGNLASVADSLAVGSLADSLVEVGSPEAAADILVEAVGIPAAACIPAVAGADQVAAGWAAVEVGVEAAEVAVAAALLSSRQAPDRSRLLVLIRLEFSSLLDYQPLQTSTERHTSTAHQ